MAFQVLYLPIGVPTFDLENAEMKFNDSKQILSRIDPSIVFPDEMLLSLDKVNAFLKDKNPNLVIVQNITFANSAYITEILRRVDCDVILWTIPEPVVDGTRLRLNSLTGAFSAGNTMVKMGKAFNYVYGSTFADETYDKIKAIYVASKLKNSLASLNLLQIGQTPEGFGFGNGSEADLMKSFGVKLYTIEAREIMSKAREYDDDDIREFIYDADRMIPNLMNFDRSNIFDAGRLFKAYFDYCNEHNIGAISSRCWPDFFTEYGTPVCAVLSILNDLGIPSACEADTYGALSIYIAQYLSKLPSFFGDPVSIDEEQNTITFWHCGMAPTSLAREDTGAQAGKHCNRGIGPCMDFGCRSSKHATVFRVGKDANGKFRFFVSTGEAPERFKQFTGTTIVVKPECNVKEMVEGAVVDGWEPHFAVALADISNEIEALGKMLGIEVVRF